ncbi:MAG: hypothetical protein QOG77_26, partial [Solirubrobacteraceae bacterium]|nr:hypothetical protein [Solirubrobacteraceae bacterium]
GLVLIPLVAAVIALSLYPQLALKRSERSAVQSVAAAKGIASGETAASREATTP